MATAYVVLISVVRRLHLNNHDGPFHRNCLYSHASISNRLGSDWNIDVCHRRQPPAPVLTSVARSNRAAAAFHRLYNNEPFPVDHRHTRQDIPVSILVDRSTRVDILLETLSDPADPQDGLDAIEVCCRNPRDNPALI